MEMITKTRCILLLLLQSIPKQRNFCKEVLDLSNTRVFRINNHYHLTLWCIFNRTHNYICQEFINSLQENNVHTFFRLAITTIYLFLSEIAGMLHSTVQPKLRSLTDSLPEQEEEGPEFISLLTDLPDLANHQNFLCRK